MNKSFVSVSSASSLIIPGDYQQHLNEQQNYHNMGRSLTQNNRGAH